MRQCFRNNKLGSEWGEISNKRINNLFYKTGILGQATDNFIQEQEIIETQLEKTRIQ